MTSHWSFAAIMVGAISLTFLFWGIGGILYHSFLLKDLKENAKSRGAILQNAISLAIHRRLSILEGHVPRLLKSKSDSALKIEIANIAKELRVVSFGLKCFLFRPIGRKKQFVSTIGNEEHKCKSFFFENGIYDFKYLILAYRTRRPVLLGPFQSKSNKLHFAASYAVTKGNNYVGVASISFTLAEILKESGWEKLHPSGMKIALRKSSGEFIHGDFRIFKMTPVIQVIKIAGGDWELALIPESGWWAGIWIHFSLLGTFAFLFGIFFVVLVFLIIDRRYKPAEPKTIETETNKESSRPKRRKKDKKEVSESEKTHSPQNQQPQFWFFRFNPFRNSVTQENTKDGNSLNAQNNLKEIQKISAQVKKMNDQLTHLVVMIESRINKTANLNSRKRIESNEREKNKENGSGTKEEIRDISTQIPEIPIMSEKNEDRMNVAENLENGRSEKEIVRQIS